jgi:hypothetical protein
MPGADLIPFGDTVASLDGPEWSQVSYTMKVRVERDAYVDSLPEGDRAAVGPNDSPVALTRFDATSDAGQEVADYVQDFAESVATLGTRRIGDRDLPVMAVSVEAEGVATHLDIRAGFWGRRQARAEARSRGIDLRTTSLGLE